MELDRACCYRALLARDRRFDGRFFTGVKTTGIYCRPICPARPPKLENVEFYACAAAAEAAGFRPCLRCRPETAPGTPAWVGSSAIVTRALRLIGAGVLDGAGIDDLAARLGVGARQLRRLFAAHLGASPIAIAGARRTHFARRLLDETDLPITEVALGAGFSSIRQFNHAMRATFRRSPSELRRSRSAARRIASDGLLSVRLPYRPPLDLAAMLRFLGPRAVPGVEQVSDESYRRTIEIGGAAGWLEVRPAPGNDHALILTVHMAGPEEIAGVVERVRRAFDLAADPLPIVQQLRRSAALRERITALPGLRVPGAWDPFELAARAILGQQVTVRGATTLAGRLVERLGTPIETGVAGLTQLFPSPVTLAQADLATIGLPGARAATIRELSRRVAANELALDGSLDLDEAVRRLCAVPGIGQWTAHYIAMRALGEPDAFPAGDLGLRRALASGGEPISEARLLDIAEEWRPWRAYAALVLWSTSAQRSHAATSARAATARRAASSPRGPRYGATNAILTRRRSTEASGSLPE